MVASIRRLGLSERVVLSESVTSVKALVIGGVFVLATPLVFVLFSSSNAMTTLVLGLAMAVQAKARIQVDNEGVLLDLLRMRRRVPYREVRYAEAVENSPARGWWPLLENTRRSGYISIRPGDRLPPAREVASALGIGLHTVLRGYQQLRDEGLVELRRGRGAVVTEAGDSLRAQLDQLARGFTESVRRLGLDDEQTLDLVRSALRGS